MKKILMLLSICGLILTIVPALLVFGQVISWDSHSKLMILGTLMWFFTAPLWMKKTDDA